MSATGTEESISLYYKEGSSDKEYHVQLVRAIKETAVPATGLDWVVTYQYGRRGSTLRPKTKHESPVSFAEAKTVYDSMVKKQLAEGYTTGADGTPFAWDGKSWRNKRGAAAAAKSHIRGRTRLLS